jgi:anti-sigma factor RsiW
MNCSEVRPILHAYVDDELDARSALELESHLGSCGACAARHREIRQLSQSVRVHASRFVPSSALEARLRSSLREHRSERPIDNGPPGPIANGPVASLPATIRPSARRRPWLGALALAAALVLAWLGGTWSSRPSTAERVGEEVVAAHVRSLLGDHLIDVVSSDRHTVNPWFQGKVPCAVGARDFASQGFALAGGRLDYLEGQPVAAVVYRHGPHAINVFVWPCEDGRERPVERFASIGYSARYWVEDGKHHWAVSDVDESALAELVDLWRSKS